MKKLACLLLTSLVFVGCNNREQQQQLKDLSTQDSALMQQNHDKDSSITSYIHSLNDIQDNLNAIKSEEHMITIARENGATDKSASIVADIKALNDLLIKNHKEINALEGQVRSNAYQDKELKKLVDNFRRQLVTKDSEIAALEVSLGRSGDSLRIVMRSFNDSVGVIGRDTKTISDMKTAMNTVHYAIGTYKELKDNGVIQREGSFIGMGGVLALKTGFNKEYFTSAQMPDLLSIPLYGRFDKLVTYHPTDSYKITGGEKVNTLIITDPATFWSTSKYLVVVITPQAQSTRNEAGLLPSTPSPVGQ